MTATQGAPGIDVPSVCVLGLGLIGGSLLRAASTRPGSFGWSPTEATRHAASVDGFAVVDQLEHALTRAAAQDALVVLAAPIPAFTSLLTAIDSATPTIALTDVASVKSPVADEVESLAPNARYIGSHPMAGTQFSGWSAGSADLFDGAAWVTCLTEESDVDVWASVAALALSVGGRVVPADPDDHDDAVARISHLPHLLALALAQVGAAGGSLPLSLAASSFADGTRVAATAPELVKAMCERNRRALVGAFDEVLGLLGVARGSLASTGGLAKITDGGHAARMKYEARGQGLEMVELSGDDLIDQLLSVGSAGGHVSGVSRAASGLLVDGWFPESD